jgi:hypothetical protein
MEGKYRSAVAHYHLHPSVEVMPEGDGSSGRLRLTSGKEVTWRASKPVRIEASHYAPEFGRRLATRRLALDLDGPLGVWLELSW